MPQWIHSRAEHILAKNPSMPKSEAFAIATQQSHALGKSPKSYGTLAGREKAKEKYKTPGDDKKTANPGGLSSSKMEKSSGFLDSAKQLLTTPIPGTPNLLMGHGQGNMAAKVSKPGAGPSAEFLKWQAQRSKAASVRAMSFADELQKISHG